MKRACIFQEKSTDTCRFPNVKIERCPHNESSVFHLCWLPGQSKCTKPQAATHTASLHECSETSFLQSSFHHLAARLEKQQARSMMRRRRCACDISPCRAAPSRHTHRDTLAAMAAVASVTCHYHSSRQIVTIRQRHIVARRMAQQNSESADSALTPQRPLTEPDPLRSPKKVCEENQEPFQRL